MYGMSGHGSAPDQFANQPMRFGEGLRVALASKINTSPPAKPHGIAHGDISGGDQRAYLSVTYDAGLSADTDLIPILSFSSSLQLELELSQRAYVDSSI